MRTSTSTPPKAVTPAQPFGRVLDAKLIMSVVAAGIMSFSGVVVETAMNVTFPHPHGRIRHHHLDRAMAHHVLPAGFGRHRTHIVLPQPTLPH